MPPYCVAFTVLSSSAKLHYAIVAKKERKMDRERNRNIGSYTMHEEELTCEKKILCY